MQDLTTFSLAQLGKLEAQIVDALRRQHILRILKSATIAVNVLLSEGSFIASSKRKTFAP